MNLMSVGFVPTAGQTKRVERVNTPRKNTKARFFLISWLSTRLLLGLELGRLALLRARPVARIIRIIRQKRNYPPSLWTLDPPHAVCVTIDPEDNTPIVRKIPVAEKT